MIRAEPLAADPEIIADIKTYLRLESAAEDALVARLGLVALERAETFTNQYLISRDVTETLPAGHEWRRLTATPVVSITAISGLSAMGVAMPLATDATAIDIDANGDGWVRATAPIAASRLLVAYSAGLVGSWAGLPEGVRQGAVRLAAHFFTNRDAAEEGAPPAAVAALWRPWRRIRFA